MENNNSPGRKAKRYPFRKGIIIDNSIFAKGIDISTSGVYVYTRHPFEVGRVAKVRFPGGLTLRALVQHNQPEVGVGLKFVDLDDRLREEIDILIRSISAKAGDIDMSKPNILLVDDSDSTRRINKIKLTLEGFNIVDASDGTGVIKELGKTETPDVVVIDMHVNVMDGLKVLAVLRGYDKWKNVPVIVFSSNSSLDVNKKFRDAGANEFFTKTTTPTFKIAQVIKGFLANRT